MLKEMQQKPWVKTFRNGSWAFVQDPPIRVNPQPEWFQIHYVDGNYDYNAAKMRCEECKQEPRQECNHPSHTVDAMLDPFTDGDLQKTDHFLEQVCSFV